MDVFFTATHQEDSTRFAREWIDMELCDAEDVYATFSELLEGVPEDEIELQVEEYDIVWEDEVMEVLGMDPDLELLHEVAVIHSDEEKMGAFMACLENIGHNGMQGVVDEMDNYVFAANSPTELAEEYVCNYEIPSFVQYYIDYRTMGDDFIKEGDYIVSEYDDKIYQIIN
jgi:hypothetical protein